MCLTTLLSACGGSSDESPPATSSSKCLGAALDGKTSCLTVNERDAIMFQHDDSIKDGIALFLHGSPGSADKVMGIFDAKVIASKHNLVALSPEGLMRTWGWLSLNDTSTDNKDIDYLTELLTKVRGDLNINSDKLYIFGYSAGGFMAYRLACEIPEQITAIVSLAGQHRGTFDGCDNAPPVKLHHLHSTSDREVPYEGRAYGDIKTVDETIEFWRIKNGCDVETTNQEQTGVTATSFKTQTAHYNNCVTSMALSEMPHVPHEANYVGGNLYQIYQYIFDNE